MSNILEARGLCKDYGLFSLKGVSFELPKGFIMGFVGPNGAGKTTTIKSILGIIKAESGSVKVFGQEGSVSCNEDIGVVMEAPMYVEDWTMRDMEKAIAPFYAKWDSGCFAKHIRRFGLDPKKKVKELSRGMKVKLQVAAALSHDAKLLILDEPTSGLDPVARDEICDLLREFVTDEDRGVLFSTHICSDLDKTADYITFILDGKIVFTGTKDDLTQKYARVAGGMDDLSAEQKKCVIGISFYSSIYVRWHLYRFFP